MTLFETMDILNPLWREAQERLQGPDVKVDGLDLWMESAKFVYKGRRVTESKTVDRIEAAFLLPRLVQAIDERDTELQARAEEAVAVIRKVLADLNEVPNAKGRAE